MVWKLYVSKYVVFYAAIPIGHITGLACLSLHPSHYKLLKS